MAPGEAMHYYRPRIQAKARLEPIQLLPSWRATDRICVAHGGPFLCPRPPLHERRMYRQMLKRIPKK